MVPRIDHDGSQYYLASYPELEGCKAHGVTPQEAIDNLGEAFELYREMAVAARFPIPGPHADPLTTIAVHVTASGPATGTATSILKVRNLRTNPKTEGLREVVTG
ncbi:MAG: type II toxin-antitoxin system HicB family antitoxin [Acidimicrobiales bacterium]